MQQRSFIEATSSYLLSLKLFCTS